MHRKLNIYTELREASNIINRRNFEMWRFQYGSIVTGKNEINEDVKLTTMQGGECY